MTLEELNRTTPVKDGEVLPMQSRDFLITQFRKLPKAPKQTAEQRAAAKAERIRIRKEAGRAEGDEDLDEDDEDENEDDQPDEERFEIAISSEFPVRRWFGSEILDHSKGAVDLSRAKTGLAFLDSHDTKAIVGIVTDVKIGDDKVLRGVVQFSRNPKAQEVKRDVQDGIRKYISVGYGVNEYTLEKTSKDEGDTYRATSWTPMEASSVAVPADPSVGHNRKAGERGFPVKVRSSITAEQSAESQTEVRNMANEVKDNAQILTDSRNASAEIVKLGKRHGIDQERVAGWIGEGRSLDSVSALILDEVSSRSKVIKLPGSEERTAEDISLSEKEQREYNLARGIMTLISNEESDGRENSIELEISQTIERSWGGKRHGGLFVPWSVRNVNALVAQQKRAGLDSGTTNAGVELKFTEPGAFIDFLYNRMRVKELGAQTISGLRDNVAFPKQTGKASGSWVAENPGSDVADSALTLGQVTTSPKTYQSSTSYSRQLLAQAVIDVDTLVRADLARDMALALDLAAINGNGSGAPVGIMNTSGVQSFTLAADSGNGGQPSYDDIVHMLEDLEDMNADQLGDPGWLTTPGIKSLLKLTARLANTIALPVWADNDTISGYKAASSNQVPKTLTKGSTSNNHALILGVFATMVIGMWGSGFELVVDPYRLKKQGMIELTTFMLTDVCLRYPQAFVVAKAQK